MSDPKPYKKRTSFWPTIISMALVLFIAGLLGLVVIHARLLSDQLKETFEVTVFLSTEATKEEALDLQSRLKSRQEIKEVRFVDRDVAASKHMAELGDNFVETLGYNPIPHSLVLQLKSAYATDASLKSVEAEIRSNKLVEDVKYAQDDFGSNVLMQINKNFNTIQLVLSALAVIMLLISISLINGTVRLNLFARRFLVKSMQYVGATDWFIIRPFLGMYLLYAIIATLAASAMLGGVLYLFNMTLGAGFLSLDPKLYAILFGILLILAIIIVLISTYFSTKKYLRLKIDQLY